MSSDTLSEELTVCEGAGYNETFSSGDESEDFSPSSEREMSAQSPNGEDKGYIEESEEVGEVGKEGSGGDGGDDDDMEDSDGDEEDDGEESCEGTLVGPRVNCPFILLAEWAVNKFLPLISDKVLGVVRQVANPRVYPNPSP